MKRKFKGRQSRLDRIERKCDRILSELLIVRHRISSGTGDIDAAIERMHRAARRMMAQCEAEKRNAISALGSKPQRE